MAVGVPETEVYAAADRVLARGERPTVERVRAELGRGSPARVGQLLETWWDRLTQRLAGETRLPALPPAVAQAFTDLWRTACGHAEQAASDALAAERTALQAQVAQADAARAEADTERGAAAAAAGAAREAQTQAETRVGDLMALVETQRHQLARLEQGINEERAEADARATALQSAQAALGSARKTAEAERAQLTAHIEAVENRAHHEVDRAREETKLVRRELGSVQRELRAATKAQQVAVQAQHASDKRAASAVSRADALATRLTATGTRRAPVKVTSRSRASRLRPAP